jgi:hypothetical protein
VIIARGGLQAGSSQIVDDQIRCCGSGAGNEDAVEAGLNWLGNNFSVTENRNGSDMTHFYYLYALERVGRLSGRRFIGGHDWYREGAEFLLDAQDGFQGFWSGRGQMGEGNRDVATSFALLFLSKGKRQVVVGRLKYGDPNAVDSPWQQHPDGLRQLVRHVERDWGRDLTWQTIDIAQAGVVDLLQAPVLVISGNQPLRLSEESSQRLRDYIDQGGCLLFEADGGDGCGDASGFERSVRQLCQTWYPGTTLDRLPPGHPVWYAQRQVDPTVLGDQFWVYGVQACCRTAIFYVPSSLSCRWQLGDAMFQRSDPDSRARAQIDAAIRIGENVIAYATGRELKDKLQQRVVIQGGDLDQPQRGTIRLSMLALDAGGNEAQRAVPNATTIIGQRVPIALAATPQPATLDREQLRDIKILWIHGRRDFAWTAQEREVLGEYLRNDGVVLATAICGNEAFADAFRREIALVLGEAPLKSMPPDHPALTNAFGGFDVRNVTIRTPAARGPGKGISRRSSPPLLEIATRDNVTNVFFSPLDLSCALESQNSVQCPGYNTEDAAKIVANLVLFALQQ